jgi:hypothetical protein
MSRASLAEQLQAVLAYRNRPEVDEPISPLQTNWRVQNDNIEDTAVADMRFERKRITTPSVAEIMRQCEPNEDTGEVDIERNDAGAIVRIGKLRFSDGNNVEKVMLLVEDGKIIQGDRRMPTGAMLGTRDQSDVQSGGTQAPTGSNLYFAAMLKSAPHRYRSGKRTKRQANDIPNPPLPPTSMSLNEARAFAGLTPIVKDATPALPCGSPRVADSFIGMRKTTCAGGGGQAWEDLSTALSEREVWKESIARLSDKDKAVLDATATAKTFEEVGLAVGQSKAYAKYNKGGRRAMIAANDNLMAAIKKMSA